jgi:hypothetical protein
MATSFGTCNNRAASSGWDLQSFNASDPVEVTLAARHHESAAILGVLHSFITFDRTAYTMKILYVVMFVWAVKCGFISEAKLCES